MKQSGKLIRYMLIFVLYNINPPLSIIDNLEILSVLVTCDIHHITFSYFTILKYLLRNYICYAQMNFITKTDCHSGFQNDKNRKKSVVFLLDICGRYLVPIQEGQIINFAFKN